MSLIDTTYFINDINVTAQKLANYQQYIDIYEQDVLRQLLGYQLYKLLIADLDVSGDPQSQRFIDLIDGAEYSFIFCGNDVYHKWDGLRNDIKRSLISYYVYYNQRNEEESYNSNVGQVISNVENSGRVDVNTKLISIWNKFIELYGSIPSNYFNLGYTSLFNNNTSYVHFNYDNSAYNFLLSNIADYPEWKFNPIRNQNIYGI